MSILASGQADTSKATIFIVDRADILRTTKAVVERVTLFNTNAAEQTAILYIKKKNGTSRKLRQYVLAQNQNGEYIEPGGVLDMEHGDVLEAITTTGSAVDYAVFGTRS